MRKILLSGLAIFIALSLSTCDMPPIGGINESLTGYEFDAEGNITGVKAQVVNGEFVFGNVKKGRAINQVIADRGLEVFEVVFMSGSSIARAAWNLGEGVSLKNVPRGATSAGINYSSVDPATAASAGAAVIFAGRKNGTLLAVGKLIAVNDDTAVFTVDANTKSVTFGLSALVVGNAVSPTPSIVVTDTAAASPPNFKRVPVYLGANISPDGYQGYVFRPGINTITATYTLAASASSFTIAQMLPAIRVINDTGNPNLIKETEPDIIGYKKIPAPYSVIKPTIDATFGASFTPATPTGVTIPFPSAALIFDFDTSAGNEIPGVISFYFQFTVCALSRVTSADGIDSKTWYIRPGYDYNYLDLGANGTGGSILVAVNPNINNITALDFSDGIEIKTVTLAP